MADLSTSQIYQIKHAASLGQAQLMAQAWGVSDQELADILRGSDIDVLLGNIAKQHEEAGTAIPKQYTELQTLLTKNPPKISYTVWGTEATAPSVELKDKLRTAESLSQAQNIARSYGISNVDLAKILEGSYLEGAIKEVLPPSVSETTITTALPSGGIVISATPEELQQAAQSQAESRCPGGICAMAINTYKVNLKDGSTILVEAFNENAAEQKAEDAGYKVAHVTKQFEWSEPSSPPVKLSDAAIQEISQAAENDDKLAYVTALKEYNLIPEDTVAFRVGGMKGGGSVDSIIFVPPSTADLIRETSWYQDARGSDSYRLGQAWLELNKVPQIELGDGTTLPKESITDKDGNVVILGWNDIPERYHDIGKSEGLNAIVTQMETDRTEAEVRLSEAGFRNEVPDVYMQAAGSPPLIEYTVPNMAKFVRDNPDGLQVLENYGFSQEVLDTVQQFNQEVTAAVNAIKVKGTIRMTDAELLAFKRALDAAGVLEYQTEGKSSEQIYQELPEGEKSPRMAERQILGQIWLDLDDDTQIAVAVLFDKDYTKTNYISSMAKDLQHLSSKNLATQILLSIPTAIISPVGKLMTLDDAKTQLNQDFSNELTVLNNYVTKNGTFDIGRLGNDLTNKPELKNSLLEQTGYKDEKELLGSLEYYNYGTTITPKEWAIAGLTAALVVIPFAGKALSTLGIVGSVVKQGIPAALGAIMLPDTIKMVQNPDVDVPSKVLAVAITTALLSGAVVGVGKFAFREIRHLWPGKFDTSGVSLEVSIPRTQLRANMTPKMAQTLVQDLERVWGGRLPKAVEEVVSNFSTPAEFQQWYSGIVRTGIMTTQLRGITNGIKAGGIKARQNPFQAALGDNVLFSVKPDMATYGSIIGKSKTGIDITPTGSMEWWSPNFSGDVAGWYLGKVNKFIPGGKMLRYSPKDIKAYPPEVFTSVAKQMQNSRFWSKVKAEAKGDNVTAVNLLIQREIYRRALLAPGRRGALPEGIYPVFKFHWSREPSGQLRPTWELEMVTPSGFKSQTFRPVHYLDKFQTGGDGTPEVASMTVYSPIAGRDLVTGQTIKLGQPMPVIITATKNAINEGIGLPTVRELYVAKFVYRPIAGIQNIFSRGKAIRPRATEASKVTTPRVWYSRAIKFDKLKVNPADKLAVEKVLKIPENQRLSIPEVAAKIEGSKPDVHGRFSSVRDPYYHPVYEYADNWVAPRVGVMLKHPTIKGAYIVVQDTSKAAQPGVWDIVGGQIDPFGVVRTNRPFGRISLIEAAQEQLLSELGVGAKGLKPVILHIGKTTEHSAAITYMFDGTIGSLKLRVPMNKWYDMVKGEWVIEPEVGAVGVLRPGQTAAVTPALYIELVRRGFDTSKLLVVDKGLPTSGVRQYIKGTFEYNALKNANIYRFGEIGGVGQKVGVFNTGGKLLWEAKGNSLRTKAFQSTAYTDEFVIPSSYREPVYTGLVPTLRPPMGYAPTMAVDRVASVSQIPRRITPPEVDLEYIKEPDYEPPATKEGEELPVSITDERQPIMVERRNPKTEITSYTPAISQTTVEKVSTLTPVTKLDKKTHVPFTKTDIPYVVTHRRFPYVPSKGSTVYVPVKVGARTYYKIPPGSITWRQGSKLKGKELRPQWYFIKEPWDQEKPVSLDYPPLGAKNIGETTPEKTIQMIGKPGAKVPREITVDLGVVDIIIKDYGKKIEFKGGGLETVAGKSLASTTKGMSIPGTGIMKVKVKNRQNKTKTRRERQSVLVT